MSLTSRLAGAAALVAVAFAPSIAQASDDFTIYDSRSTFEAALGASHVTTPSASGVTFSTGGISTAPITYAPGAIGNLFGSSTESIGYAGVGLNSLNMALPSGLNAFGFDYAYWPAKSLESVTFEGRFCNDIFGCKEYTREGLSNGSGFIGIIADSGLDGVSVSGTATTLQVANLTLAGSVTATPEPATVAPMATGLAALAGMGVARRRRNEG